MAQPSKPLKSGDFAVSVAEDPVLWTDRKRVLGLPLSFTRYSLTANKLVLNTGFMSLHEEEVRLYRVRDISLTRTLGERLSAWAPFGCRAAMLPFPLWRSAM